MKKFFEEFKAFALKGNMMDMAIGVIIGGAFSTLVTSLTDNLISPILGILGKVNFDAMMWDVFGDGKLVFKYGAFITAVINFLIMAFVLFCIVKAMNKLMEMGKHEEPAAEEPAAPAAPTQEELLALMEGYEYSVYSSHESDFSDAPEGSQEKRMNTASMMAITMISPVFLSKDIRERWRCFTEGKRRWSLGIALRKETLKS